MSSIVSQSSASWAAGRRVRSAEMRRWRTSSTSSKRSLSCAQLMSCSAWTHLHMAPRGDEEGSACACMIGEMVISRVCAHAPRAPLAS
eukprot:6992868-Prymnesium_polylepis.1